MISARAAGPPGLPLVGHLPWLLRDKLGFLVRCAERHGDVVRLRLGKPTLLLCRPDDVRHVLLENAGNYDKSPRLRDDRARRLHGSGVLTAGGDEHARKRLALHPAFRRGVAAALEDALHGPLATLLRRWDRSEQVEAYAGLQDLASTAIVHMLFGDAVDDEDGLRRAVATRRRYLQYLLDVPVARAERLPLPIVLRHRRALRVIDATIADQIARHRAARGRPTSLLGHLLDSCTLDGAPPDDAWLREELLTLLVTGFETTAAAMAWALLELSRRPALADAIAQEVDRVAGTTRPRAEHLLELEATRRTLDETLRLHPPTWLFVRVAMSDDLLPSGAAVPAGTKIYLCQFVVHRHPSWWPEPETFDPDRFAPEQVRDRPAFAYFPFGGGPRVCLGKHLALLEATLSLATLVRRYHLRPVPGSPVRHAARIVLEPKPGVRLHLARRG